ncbi:MAG: membrane protein insertion efficiency factor YidD [Thermodesulfobacteriota bacterium]
MKAIFKFLIRLYRAFISPLLPPACRFYPSCSEYALDAFGSNGFFKALYLTIKRIFRCHPLSDGGYDPVPGSISTTGIDKT